MQGVEVFESVGAAAEEPKPKDAIVREAASAASHAELPVACAEGAKPNKFMMNNLVKQSGVPGVKWNSTCFAWEVAIPKYDSKGKRKGNTNRKFSVKKFMVNGRSEAEADAAALVAAKAFRAELVRKGVLQEPKELDPNFTSDVPGVAWHKRDKRWEVRISLKKRNPKEPQKAIYGGYFTEKAAAEAEALRLQELHGLQREVKAVNTLSALPVFRPKVPYSRVNWNQGEQQWHACCSVGGLTRNFRVKPKDHSEAELERSFQVAVAWKKRQEKEKEKMGKCKTKPKPQKKRRKCSQKSWVVNIESFARAALLNFQTARCSQTRVRVPENIQVRHVPFKATHAFFFTFDEVSSSRLQICPLYIFENYPPQMVKSLDLNIGVSPGLAAWFRTKSTLKGPSSWCTALYVEGPILWSRGIPPFWSDFCPGGAHIILLEPTKPNYSMSIIWSKLEISDKYLIQIWIYILKKHIT